MSPPSSFVDTFVVKDTSLALAHSMECWPASIFMVPWSVLPSIALFFGTDLSDSDPNSAGGHLRGAFLGTLTPLAMAICSFCTFMSDLGAISASGHLLGAIFSELGPFPVDLLLFGTDLSDSDPISADGHLLGAIFRDLSPFPVDLLLFGTDLSDSEQFGTFWSGLEQFWSGLEQFGTFLSVRVAAAVHVAGGPALGTVVDLAV